MDNQSRSGTLTLVMTFVIATLLMMIPLPDFLVWWRPNLILLVLIYWVMALPHRVGILGGWMLGIITDVTMGSVLGVHGLSMAIIAYIILILNNRLRLFPILNQAFIIALMVGLDLVLSLWIQNYISTQPMPGSYWFPIITSCILWPGILLLLRNIRRSFNVR